MSYGPPGYPQQPMGYGYPNPYHMQSDPRAPGRRAAILMWVLGALALILTGLMLLVGLVPLDQYPPESRNQLQQVASESGTNPERLLNLLKVIGGVGVACSLSAIVLAFFVWRSIGAAILIAIVVSGLLIGLGVLSLLGTLSGGDGAVPAMCMSGLYIAIIGLLFFWLMNAWRNAPLVRQFNAQTGMGYPQGQLYGQPQQYGPPGYPQYPGVQQYGGYPPPPPPPPPPGYDDSRRE